MSRTVVGMNLFRCLPVCVQRMRDNWTLDAHLVALQQGYCSCGTPHPSACHSPAWGEEKRAQVSSIYSAGLAPALSSGDKSQICLKLQVDTGDFHV